MIKYVEVEVKEVIELNSLYLVHKNIRRIQMCRDRDRNSLRSTSQDRHIYKKRNNFNIENHKNKKDDNIHNNQSKDQNLNEY